MPYPNGTSSSLDNELTIQQSVTMDSFFNQSYAESEDFIDVYTPSSSDYDTARATPMSPSWESIASSQSSLPSTPVYSGTVVDQSDVKFLPVLDTINAVDTVDPAAVYTYQPLYADDVESASSLPSPPILRSNDKSGGALADYQAQVQLLQQQQARRAQLSLQQSWSSTGSTSDSSSFDTPVGSLGLPSGFVSTQYYDTMSAGSDYDTVSPFDDIKQESFYSSGASQLVNEISGLKIELNSTPSSRIAGRRRSRARKSYEVRNINGIDAQIEQRCEHACGEFHSKTGKRCTATFKRKEHLKRHKKAMELDGFIPECFMHKHVEDACKSKKDKRPDNMLQHYFTHLKHGRNSCLLPSFMFFGLLKEHDETSKADSVMKSVGKMLHSHIAQGKVKPGQPDFEKMKRHPLYRHYKREMDSHSALARRMRRWDRILDFDNLKRLPVCTDFDLMPILAKF